MNLLKKILISWKSLFYKIVNLLYIFDVQNMMEISESAFISQE